MEGTYDCVAYIYIYAKDEMVQVGHNSHLVREILDTMFDATDEQMRAVERVIICGGGDGGNRICFWMSTQVAMCFARVWLCFGYPLRLNFHFVSKKKEKKQWRSNVHGTCRNSRHLCIPESLCIGINYVY